jgi:hypothetical protein
VCGAPDAGRSDAGSPDATSTDAGKSKEGGSDAEAGGIVGPIPDATNRPVYDATTHVLTWIGPMGGGPSTPGNVAQTRTLTASGSIKTSADGQNIEGLRISGTVTVTHNNVTIRQSSIVDPKANQDNSYQIFQVSGTTGLVVEDCDLDGNALLGNGGTSNITGTDNGFGPEVSDATIRRNSMYDSEQGVRYHLNRLSITENWFHLPGGTDADQIEIYPVGAVCDNLVIEHNTFEGPDNSQGGYNSAINMTTASGLPAGTIGPHITIDTNWFRNNPKVHTINNDASGGGTMGFSFTNNGFFHDGLFGSGGGTISPNTGNFVMATLTSLSGKPINGTGGV